MLHQEMLALALRGADWVLWLLVVLSVLCVAVALERAARDLLHRTPAAPLRAAMEAFAEDGRADVLAERLSGLRGIEARVLAAAARAGAQGGPESAEEALAARKTAERIGMERGLVVLGTVGANAPFIGLFGTVLGIIRAFHDLSLDTHEAAGAVMAGISEALVATAVGLLVAIPAVVLYNLFQRRNRTRLARVESLGRALLARLKARES